MNLRTKAILINGAILLTLLLELHFHPAQLVGIAALLLIPAANLPLLVRARRNQRKRDGR